MPTFGGKPVTLAGNPLQVGDTLPNFTVLNNDLTEVTFDQFNNKKYRVISVVPSLDTGVCDFQTRKINEELAKNEQVTVLTISNDLPFAQARWCGSSGLESVIALSDYRDLDFANKAGTLIEQFRLQTRAVFVVDQNNKVLYAEYLDEITNHPNYDALLQFLKEN